MSSSSGLVEHHNQQCSGMVANDQHNITHANAFPCCTVFTWKLRNHSGADGTIGGGWLCVI